MRRPRWREAQRSPCRWERKGERNSAATTFFETRGNRQDDAVSSVDTFSCTDTTTIYAATRPSRSPFLSKSHFQSISSSYRHSPSWLRGKDRFPFPDPYRGRTGECTLMRAGCCVRKLVNPQIVRSLTQAVVLCSGKTGT